jgi:hypothetical protein
MERAMSSDRKPIRFGVNFLPNHATDTLNWVKVAEETGFDIAGIADSQSLYRDVYVVEALVAANTKTIRFGSRVIKDSELIALIGTEVDDGYLVLAKDCQEIERILKEFLERVRRVHGKRLVVANGQIVTAYHASRRYQRRLLRNAHECDLCE